VKLQFNILRKRIIDILVESQTGHVLKIERDYISLFESDVYVDLVITEKTKRQTAVLIVTSEKELPEVAKIIKQIKGMEILLVVPKGMDIKFKVDAVWYYNIEVKFE